MSTSSTKKTLSILDLFQGDKAELTTEEIAASLRVPISTCYRYLKVMSDQGYLVSSSGSGYSLGPKIILLSKYLQRNDPIISCCGKFADAIVKSFSGTATINRVYKQSFISIYAKSHRNETRTGFGEGNFISILSGANAIVIQAFLSRHLQNKVYLENRDELVSAGRGKNFQEFKSALQAVRQARICKVQGVVRPDSTGFAAPLLGSRKQILGTFAFSMLTSELTPEIEEAVKLRVHEIGIRASEMLHKTDLD